MSLKEHIQDPPKSMANTQGEIFKKARVTSLVSGNTLVLNGTTPIDFSGGRARLT